MLRYHDFYIKNLFIYTQKIEFSNYLMKVFFIEHFVSRLNVSLY